MRLSRTQCWRRAGVGAVVVAVLVTAGPVYGDVVADRPGAGLKSRLLKADYTVVRNVALASIRPVPKEAFTVADINWTSQTFSVAVYIFQSPTDARAYSRWITSFVNRYAVDNRFRKQNAVSVVGRRVYWGFSVLIPLSCGQTGLCSLGSYGYHYCRSCRNGTTVSGLLPAADFRRVVAIAEGPER
jgi:hypothetical protein